MDAFPYASWHPNYVVCICFNRLLFFPTILTSASSSSNGWNRVVRSLLFWNCHSKLQSPQISFVSFPHCKHGKLFQLLSVQEAWVEASLTAKLLKRNLFIAHRSFRSVLHAPVLSLNSESLLIQQTFSDRLLQNPSNSSTNTFISLSERKYTWVSVILTMYGWSISERKRSKCKGQW